MNTIKSLTSEFEHEAQTTRKHLERLSDNKFAWQPHKKSFTLQGLASHIVECLSWTDAIFNSDEFNFDPATYKPYQAASVADMLKAFDEHVASGKQALAGADEAALMKPWSLKIMGNSQFEKPKAEVLRDFVLSHIIHHRGQLSVYERLLEIPVPGSYGPSADEPPPGVDVSKCDSY
ncbi:MAG: hypothetical protein QOD75_3292 [Blastocatellia bacterium]|nr:hypothetical protein [Blastocatellia bacterium]